MHPQCVTNADFGQEASSDHIFLRTRLVKATTVNGARYRDTITRFFLPKLDDIDVADTWFQQDDATCHTANETIQLPHKTFPGRVLSRFDDQNWPPGSCDLTPLDFFLRDYLKWKSTSTIPQSHAHYERKLNAASTKFSHNYAERWWKIWTMCYSINNPILCTLWFA